MLDRTKQMSDTSLTALTQMVIRTTLNSRFCAHAITGQTPIGARLRQILCTYVPRVEDNPRHKPISVLVITDGAPSESLDGLGTLE
jgi:hypothetical protein